MKRYPWKWAKDATYVICGGVFHAMPRVPPDTARQALVRRWLRNRAYVGGKEEGR